MTEKTNGSPKDVAPRLTRPTSVGSSRDTALILKTFQVSCDCGWSAEVNCDGRYIHVPPHIYADGTHTMTIAEKVVPCRHEMREVSCLVSHGNRGQCRQCFKCGEWVHAR